MSIKNQSEIPTIKIEGVEDKFGFFSKIESIEGKDYVFVSSGMKVKVASNSDYRLWAGSWIYETDSKHQKEFWVRHYCNIGPVPNK